MRARWLLILLLGCRGPEREPYVPRGAGIEPEARAGYREALRLEYRGEMDGIPVYDDYAHHPTEVRASIEALREIAPGRIVAVFQPHLYSRTRAFAPEFGAALAGADEVVVTDVYPAREVPEGALAGVSGLDVLRETADRNGGRGAWWAPDLGAADRAVRRIASGDDLVVTIGAGDVSGLAGWLVEGGP